MLLPTACSDGPTRPQPTGGSAWSRAAAISASISASLNGAPGLVFAPGGTVRVVFDFVVVDGRIVEIALVADPESIARMDLSIGA
jgi:hypothetical protein